MLPAAMLVDWVRVYQLEDDPRHFVGCDHPTHPTRKFIEAHRWRYQRDTENIPLQKIQRVRSFYSGLFLCVGLTTNHAVCTTCD